MRIAFHTLGCKVNHYETEAIREAFASRGAMPVGEEEHADVYLINTCTVTNIADRKSRQYIRRVKRINPAALVVVTGCYAQVEPEEVASIPEVDMVVGNGQKARICDLVFRKLLACEGNNDSTAINGDSKPGAYAGSIATHASVDNENESFAVQNVSGHVAALNESESDAAEQQAEMHVLPRGELTEYEDMGLVSSSEPGMTRAYIKIQEGCDRFCSYCLIPFARGPVRSRHPDEIIKEAGMLLDSGVREIVLTGINTALYGIEEGFAAAFSEQERKEGLTPMEMLLARFDAVEMPDGDDFRVRLSSLEPTVVDKDHVEKIIRYRRLCHHLHLSAQNGSNKILRSMNRHYTREEYLDIVRAIREYDPNYGITTDIIVGFPGEDEEDFRQTVDLVREAGFGKTHIFRYSPRKGTVGAKLPDAVPGQVKNDRADLLEQAADEIAVKFRKSNFGFTHIVLAEEEQDGYITGYTDNYIKVYIEGKSPRLGEFCRVQLTQIFKDGCKAEMV